MLIDTHCHLHDPEWFTPEQQTEFLANAHQNGVEKVICIGTNPEDSLVARDFAAKHDNIYWTYGIHPEFAKNTLHEVTETNLLVKPAELANTLTLDGRLNNGHRERLKEQPAGCEEVEPRKDGRSTGSLEMPIIQPSGPVAIGEIGLDYHYDGYDRSAQIKLFEQMLQLALDLNLPVSLHIREAFADAFAVLDNFPNTTGVVHSFTGSKKELQRALDRGFSIGVNGLATYSTLPLPPLENIVLETDAPFLTPKPFRGTINKPGYVRLVAAYLAEKLGVAESEITEQTTKNARKIFQI